MGSLGRICSWNCYGSARKNAEENKKTRVREVMCILRNIEPLPWKSNSADNCVIQGYDAASNLHLKMVPIGCPQTSVINYHYSLRNNPEERSYQLLRGGNLKSRIIIIVTYSECVSMALMLLNMLNSNVTTVYCFCQQSYMLRSSWRTIVKHINT